MAELNRQLAAAIRSIQTAAQWQQWLRFAARFPGSSYGNLMLLYRQAPNATRLADYDTWHAHGIRIKAGETALRIVTATTPAQPGTKIQYRPTPIFDISQTTAAALTTPLPTPPAQLWQALVDDASARGYRVLRTDWHAADNSASPPVGSSVGSSTDEPESAPPGTDFRRREISVAVAISDVEACQALAHELVHIVMRHPHTQSAQQASEANGHDQRRSAVLDSSVNCRGIDRIAAESVSFMIMTGHGHAPTHGVPGPTDWPTPADRDDDPAHDDDLVHTVGVNVAAAGGQLLLATGAPAAAASIDLIQERIEQAAVRTNALRVEAQALSAAIGADDLDPIRAALHDAHLYYRDQLPGSWAEREIEFRNIDEPARATGAGLAPADPTALLDHLRTRGHTDKDIEAAGLATQRRDGQLQDRFRDRLMFPIRDHDNQIVGFTGRLNPERPIDRYHPKWLNTPETVLYRKSEILDGLGENRDQIRSGRAVVLVEGRSDRMAVEAAGGIGLATGGTAFTQQQAQALRDVLAPGQPVILGYDDDTAGHQAAERAWPLIAPNGERPVTVLELGPDQDPGDANRSGDLPDAITTARPAELVLADRQIQAAGRVLTEENLPRQYDFYQRLIDQHIDNVPPEHRGVYVAQLAARLDVDAATAVEHAAQKASEHQPDDQQHNHQLQRLQAVVTHARDAVAELAERRDELTALVNEPPQQQRTLADGRTLS